MSSYALGMNLRGGKAPVPQLGGDDHLGESSSEDEQVHSPRRGKGKARKARATGGLRIKSAEKKMLKDTLLRMFAKPGLYEETILSPEQVADVIAACTFGTSEDRAAVFDRKRVLAQWNLILTLTFLYIKTGTFECEAFARVTHPQQERGFRPTTRPRRHFVLF